MLMHAWENQRSKNILNLAVQIEQDKTLLEDVKIEDFTNEFYSVRDIRWIKQIFNYGVY